MRFFNVFIAFVLTTGCSGNKQTQEEHQLTKQQSERKMQILSEQEIIGNTKVLVGRSVAEEEELLSLANRTAKKDNERWFQFDVPRRDRPADYKGPWDEGDGSLVIHVVDGTIVGAKYTVAEF